MSELHHECGVAAIYHLPGDTVSPLCPSTDPNKIAQLIPRMLLDMQNRGQLSAGITRFHPQPQNHQLLDTYRDVGSVSEVFRLSHSGKSSNLLTKYSGPAAIGHVRYATCGKDDKSYAQPIESHSFDQRLWFSFAFNGQLANYKQLVGEMLKKEDYYLVRETDTEVLRYELIQQLQEHATQPLDEMMGSIHSRLDGAYSLAMLNARGEMLIARDPLGIKPMSYAQQGQLFAAASESVALLNLGFKRTEIKSLKPGHAITLSQTSGVEIKQFTNPQKPQRSAHCFFEWIYFANVASTMDDRSVYLSRTDLGAELAQAEKDEQLFEIDDDTIVVPVPDTSKAAADAMAYHLGVPSREGLMRNRYSGRTFIESSQENRMKKAKIKYTPLREVLEGKKVILVEDSIVRSTTMKALLERVKEEGGAKEIHVRVACPPIMAPCFYGIDMSTIRQLFGPKFYSVEDPLTIEVQEEMARTLKCDSLRYLPIEAVARAIKKPANALCQACITGKYPTEAGQRLYQLDLKNSAGQIGGDAIPDGRAHESKEAENLFGSATS